MFTVLKLVELSISMVLPTSGASFQVLDPADPLPNSRVRYLISPRLLEGMQCLALLEVVRWPHCNFLCQSHCSKLYLFWQAQPCADGLKFPSKIHHHVLHPLILYIHKHPFSPSCRIRRHVASHECSTAIYMLLMGTGHQRYGMIQAQAISR